VKFGPVAIEDAEGAILAHSLGVGPARLRKGQLIRAEDIALLREAGVTEVIAARLTPDDIGEDEAAACIARALRFHGIEVKPAATGRVNLHAERAGVFTVAKDLIDAINHVDPSVTIATLAHHATVIENQMVATVKIIPFAAPKQVVEQVEALCAGQEAFAVHPFAALKVGMIQTVLPGLKESVLDKTRRITEARLALSGSEIVEELRTAHDTAEVARAARDLGRGSDMLLIFGASAISDDEDVIPAAIRVAGGRVERTGMPVDPGNLLVVGELGGKPVLGAPGCARSPKENGFDWVLDRLIAGLEVTGDDIAGMGVGGLLMEIPTRPQPREPAKRPAEIQVHAVVLAAGRSSRMGGPNKLLARFGGEPLIRRSVGQGLASRASGVTVVTGHQAERVREALEGLKVEFAENPDFATGLASSLRAGVARVPVNSAGALIMLGDMPGVSSADLDRLIGAFVRAGGATIVRATHNGKRGNPVILPRSLFPEVAQLEGDTGARHLVELNAADVIDVELGAAASVDVDTPEALAEAGGVLVG
jgi:molybdenum cofactor cytidylyltransferase